MRTADVRSRPMPIGDDPASPGRRSSRTTRDRKREWSRVGRCEPDAGPCPQRLAAYGRGADLVGIVSGAHVSSIASETFAVRCVDFRTTLCPNRDDVNPDS